MTTFCNIMIQKFKSKKRRIYSWQIGTPTIYKQSNSEFNYADEFRIILDNLDKNKRLKYETTIEKEVGYSLSEIFKTLEDEFKSISMTSRLLYILNNLDDEEDNYDDEIYEDSDSYLSEE